MESFTINDSTLFAGSSVSGVWKKDIIPLGTNDITGNAVLVHTSPNPFTSMSTISLSSNTTNATLVIYDAFGKEVKRLDNITGKEIIITRENLPNGIYFYKLTADNIHFITGKLVAN